MKASEWPWWGICSPTLCHADIQHFTCESLGREGGSWGEWSLQSQSRVGWYEHFEEHSLADVIYDKPLANGWPTACEMTAIANGP